MRKISGFTFLELLIVIAILSIILSASAPRFSRWIDQHNTSSNVRGFMHIIRFARYTALNNSQNMTLCPALNGVCNENWNNPINVFHDKDKNQKIGEEESILMKTHIPPSQNSVITRAGTGNHIKFNWNGHAFGSATTFVVCAKGDNDQASRQIVISFQGRIRSQNYLSSNGTPYASLGDLTCT